MHLVLKNRESGETERLNLDSYHISFEGDAQSGIDHYLLLQPCFSDNGTSNIMDLFANKGMASTVINYVSNIEIGEFRSTIVGKNLFAAFRTSLGEYSKKTGKSFATRSDDDENLWVKRIK